MKFVDLMLKINEKFALSRLEIKLLDLVAIAHSSDRPIFVGDLINQTDITSKVTLHQTVKKLINKKLLISKMNKEDSRYKNVLLTKLALRRYENLHQAVNRATA